ncbi:WD repeat-containing protein 55 [Lolium perenne]|uniref:WD repeat-containing protein 55 n=1 Tax=Lolium perenne TaxID=4522 RepID=UPI0021F5D757|nr:WD repeat-containing protein 55 [Lolium perenne]
MEALHDETPFDLDFHPSAPLVVTSLINGELHLFRYADGLQPERLFAVKAHKESCRAVRFVDSGTVILTGSADSSILASDVETGKAIARLEDAHDNAINRVVCLTETTVASGDDEGCIKVWDTRQRSCCNTFHRHEDYISDMIYVAGSNQILATSGDGTLSVNNLRGGRVKAQSEFSEDELLSLVIMKNGQKVVCGTPSGAILLYSWGHFKDCSDRFLGHSHSVDTLLKLDEETLISGAADGVIRLVSILPNQIKQPLAEHSEYPIEAIGFSHDRKYLGSVSHDKILKLWDMEELLAGPQLDNHNELPEAAAAAEHDELPEANVAVDHNEVAVADSDDDGMDVDMEPSSSTASKSKKKGKGKRLNGFQPDFFADL